MYAGVMSTRWDGDGRGSGVGDAARLVPGASQLVDAFNAPTWVAEEPEAHLLPHIEAWCRIDSRLKLCSARVDGAAGYLVELEWRGPSEGVGQARAAVFSLIGAFAESATYVRQRRVMTDGEKPAGLLRFEVGTGELSPDSRFAPHGHVVVIDVAGVL
jgi:hypothetical protein